MIPFRRILFPVDYSEPCRSAVPYVKDMLAKFRAELIVLRAFDRPDLDLAHLGAGVAPMWTPEQIQAREEARLKEFTGGHFDGIALRTILHDGGAAEAVDAAVRREGIDLVMMPTRGHGAFRRLLLGSTTSKVLHDTSCAVWTDAHAASEAPAYRPEVPYRRVICALGLDEESRAVLHGAAAIAQHYGAELHMVHSIETPPAAYEIDFGPFRQMLADSAQEGLQKLRAGIQMPASIHVDSGAIASAVRAVAEKHQADLVVTGRGHAQGGVSRVWSALYSIVRESPCPVLSL